MPRDLREKTHKFVEIDLLSTRVRIRRRSPPRRSQKSALHWWDDESATWASAGQFSAGQFDDADSERGWGSA